MIKNSGKRKINLVAAVALVGLMVAACSEVVETGDFISDFQLPDWVENMEADLEEDETPPEDGESVCDDGETLCGEFCVDLMNDIFNCGECGLACEEGQVCSNGTCSVECEPGLTQCHALCVDVSSDPAHCGECDNACPAQAHADPVCTGGECDFECQPGWWDLTDEPGCETECTFTSASEVCNGVDDNCNGSVDEGFDCPMNRNTACTTTCGSIGTGVCGLDCTYPDPSDCDPPDETCNGVDDDCDDEVDNGFDCARGTEVACVTDCGTTGQGVCTSACEIPTGSGCASGAEICNGEDDNCNGSADESFACVMGSSLTCTTSCGSSGTGYCSDTCTLPGPADCTPPAETCNGIDDDCDEVCDNGLGCCRGSSEGCTTSCGSDGIRTCSSTCAWGSCNPPAETCNGQDDDCDGTCDNGYSCCRGATGTCTTACSTTGTRTCSSTCAWGSCTPPSETCNGEDDDCDGSCDEGFSCCAGASGNCATTCGSVGSRTCTSACVWGSCTPPSEICNGVDDDCDGLCDDGFACCRNSTASCTTSCESSGTRICSASCAWGNCTPPAETCNGQDDDCDGLCDNGYTCCAGLTSSCTTTCGSPGSRTCTGSCSWSACNPPAETCNGEDDDCDGLCDDGYTCCAGQSGSCTTSCGSPGTRLCSGSCTWGACTTLSETCNGIDDDCDGLCDEGWSCCSGTSTSCATSCGTTGTQTCSGSCMWGSCVPPAETCNGADDDCDGLCDETYTCCAGQSGSCTTSCGSEGTQTCSATCAWSSCTPPSETCNGDDDDCDGLCDEGWTCCSGTSRACSVSLCSGTQTCTSACSWGSCFLGSPPSNDTCSGAVNVGSGGTFNGTTCGAGNDYTASCGGSGADVVYRVDLSQRSRVQASTCGGASWNTILHLRSGGCPGTEVTCSDNACDLQSSIDRILDPGTYYIIVDSPGTDSGPFSLSVTITPSTVPNDTCTSPTPLTIGTDLAGTNVGAMNDYTSGCGGTGPDVVYSFTLGSASDLFIGVVSADMDPVIYLSTTCGSSNWCNDDAYAGVLSSVLIQDNLPAGTYYLVVDGLGGSTGTFTIETYRHGNWTTGDGCANPKRLYDGATGNTGLLWDDYTPGCMSNDSYDEVFYFIVESPLSVTVDTCSASWDTILFMRNDCDSGPDVACNDDGCGTQSSITGAGLATGIYFVMVDGWGGYYGSYTLNVTGL